MTSTTDDEIDNFLSEIIARGKFTFMRFARSAVLATAATLMSTWQNHFSYSSVRLWFVVLILGAFNRTAWMAVIAIAWLFALYMTPPELITWVASTIRPSLH